VLPQLQSAPQSRPASERSWIELRKVASTTAIGRMRLARCEHPLSMPPMMDKDDSLPLKVRERPKISSMNSRGILGLLHSRRTHSDSKLNAKIQRPKTETNDDLTLEMTFKSLSISAIPVKPASGSNTAQLSRRTSAKSARIKEAIAFFEAKTETGQDYMNDDTIDMRDGL
jgi:hypothetical protein